MNPMLAIRIMNSDMKKYIVAVFIIVMPSRRAETVTPETPDAG